MASRTVTDAELTESIALPNAASTVNTNSIDLGQTTPYPITEKISVRITTTAATAANNKNINIRLMDSAEAAANFTNVALVANPVLLINEGSSLYAAGEVIIALPPNVQRYIRATCLGEANGGDSSDGTLKIEVLT